MQTVILIILSVLTVIALAGSFVGRSFRERRQVARLAVEKVVRLHENLFDGEDGRMYVRLRDEDVEVFRHLRDMIVAEEGDPELAGMFEKAAAEAEGSAESSPAVSIETHNDVHDAISRFFDEHDGWESIALLFERASCGGIADFCKFKKTISTLV